MTTLADYTSPTLIIPQLRTRDTAGVIGELCSSLHRAGRIKELLPFYHTVMSHEMLTSTATAPGWALPHARVSGLKQLSFAVGRSNAGLKWAGLEPINLVFLFAVPEEDGAPYLTLLSGLARFSRDSIGYQTLLEAQTSSAMLQVLHQIILRHPQPVVAFA